MSALLLPDGETIDAGITAAGRWSSYVPTDAEPLPGRFVLPGLVDAHCHLSVGRDESGSMVGLDVRAAADNLTAARAAGVTAIRDVGSPGSVTLQLLSDSEDSQLLVSGRFLAPAGQYYQALHEPVPNEDLVNAALAEVARGARWVKLIGDFRVFTEAGPSSTAEPTYPIADVRRLVDAVHAEGARVATHSTTGHAKSLIEAGVDSIEHGLGLDENDLAALAQRGGAWTPTLCAVTANAPSVDDPERHAQYLQLRERLATLLPLAVKLGVTVMTGTDVVGTIAREVTLLVEFGLEPTAALTAATTAARRFLGLPGLVEDHTVDLVMYHDDPRDTPETLTRPAAIIARGVRIL